MSRCGCAIPVEKETESVERFVNVYNFVYGNLREKVVYIHAKDLFNRHATKLLQHLRARASATER